MKCNVQGRVAWTHPNASAFCTRLYKVCALGNEPWWMTPEFPASIPEGADSDLRPARG